MIELELVYLMTIGAHFIAVFYEMPINPVPSFFVSAQNLRGRSPHHYDSVPALLMHTCEARPKQVFSNYQW